MNQGATPQGGLPLLTHGVGINASADLLRDLMVSDDANPFLDEFERMHSENPELVQMLSWLFSDHSDAERAIAITAAAFTYRMLRTQAEVNNLAELVNRG
jgi:hypothetical protein